MGREKTMGMLFLILLFAAWPATAQTSDQFIDLGTLGGLNSRADFINDHGQVIGVADRTPPLLYSHAFSWTASGGMIDIIASNPTISAAELDSHLIGVSNTGHVFGNYSAYSPSYAIVYHAFGWSEARGAFDLADPILYRSLLQAVSKNGKAAGVAWAIDNSSGVHGIFWSERDGIVDMGVPPGTTSMNVDGINSTGQVIVNSAEGGFLWTVDGGYVSIGATCMPRAINDKGEVTGSCGSFGNCTTQDCTYAPFFWSEATGLVRIATGSTSSLALFISNSGHVAGDGPAFIWSAASGVIPLSNIAVHAIEPVGMSDDGLVGLSSQHNLDSSYRTFVSDRGGPLQPVSLGPPTLPRAMSANGQLVGTASGAGYARGFSWTAGGGILEMPALAGNLSEAMAVNNRGQVAGISWLVGGRGAHAVLWNTKPLPLPVSVLLHRATDGRWFNYQFADNVIGSKGFLDLTRSMAYTTVSRSDFDGDGAADVLLRDLTPSRDENGRWVLYTLSGSTLTSQGFVDGLTRNADWQVVSTEDFDGDAKADLLLRNALDGRWLLYLLDSHVIKSQAVMALSTELTDTFQGAGDFNGDGRSDVLLRRADGSWLMYLLDGLGSPVQGSPAMTTNIEFSMQSLGDFNGDGNTDVLVRRTDGRWFLYLLDGAGILASGAPAITEVADFVLSEVADFSGDGKADVLLRRQSDGRWFLYTMNGTEILASGAPDMTRNLAFQMVSTGDMSSDGKADVLMRRDDGRWVLYEMDGPMVAGKIVPDMTRNIAWAPQVP